MNFTDAHLAWGERICFAFDNFSSVGDIGERAKELAQYGIGYGKIGMEAFDEFGGAAIQAVREAGLKVFLDVKKKDIPQTVENTIKKLVKYDANMINIHADGGIEMMKYAMEGARKGADIYSLAIPKIIGITLLTSIDKKCLNNELRIPGEPKDHAYHLAMQCIEAGLPGIVCAGTDVANIRKTVPEDFYIITPGIRMPTDDVNDQKRITTPSEAINDGSSLLVIGRPMTAATAKERETKIYNILEHLVLHAA